MERCFLQGNTLSWSSISKPVEMGGLNLRPLKLFNVALLGKLVWSLLHHPNKLWVKVYREIYCKDQDFMHSTQQRRFSYMESSFTGQRVSSVWLQI